MTAGAVQHKKAKMCLSISVVATFHIWVWRFQSSWASYSFKFQVPRYLYIKLGSFKIGLIQNEYYVKWLLRIQMINKDFNFRF